MDNQPLSLTERLTDKVGMLSDYKVAIPLMGFVFWALAQWVYPTWYFDEDEPDVDKNISKASRWIAVLNMLATALILWSVKVNPTCDGQVISGLSPF
jgi:hypothetical protein